jgi:glucan 1,4-alpha-glucosidase
LKPNQAITSQSHEKKWFIGAITDENSRSASIPLDFLDKNKKYVATIYRDADNANWKTNPEAYKIESFIVDNKTQLMIKLAEGGGAAVSILPASTEQLKQLKGYKL